MKDNLIKVVAATPVIKVAHPTENAKAIIALALQAAERGASIVVMSELCVTGSTCGDLFRQEALLASAENAVSVIASATAHTESVLVIGAPVSCDGAVYNAAIVLHKGNVLGISTSATSRGVFSAGGEVRAMRYAGQETILGAEILYRTAGLDGVVLGCEIGADARAVLPSSAHLVLKGANVIAHLDAYPESADSFELRVENAKYLSRSQHCARICANAGKGESTTDYVFGAGNLIVENGKVLSKTAPLENAWAESEIDTGFLNYTRRNDKDFF